MPSPPVLIRALHDGDVGIFRELRLRALREDPVPFLATYDEDAALTVEEVTSRVRPSDGAAVLGAFREGVLIGMLGYYRHVRIKAQHRVSMWGMYVAPEERRHGVGKTLVLEAISRIGAIDGVEQVELNVVAGEHPARRLYLGLGFQVQGTLRYAMKTESRYFDEEMLVFWLRCVPQGPALG